MRIFILSLFLVANIFCAVAYAQNNNTVKRGTQIQNGNVRLWDEAAARTYISPASNSYWPYGAANCSHLGWSLNASGTYLGADGHTFTREMYAKNHCILNNQGPGEDFVTGDYTIQTCLNGTRWAYNSHWDAYLCESGYYLNVPVDKVANGKCSCDQGRFGTDKPIEIGTGNMYESATDFISGDGRLRFDRHYNSNPYNPMVSARGWRNGFEARHLFGLEDVAPTIPPGFTFASTSSATYTSAASACTEGFQGIAANNPLYSGLIATYIGNGQCKLSNGRVIPVFNTNESVVLTSAISDASFPLVAVRPDGNSYTFSCFNGICTTSGQSEVTLAPGANSYTLTVANGDTESYDINGNLLQIVSRDGYTQTISRNSDETISKVTDNHGRQLAFTYNVNSNLSTLTLPDKTTIQYAYDADGNLTSVTYGDNSVIGYQYNNTTFLAALTTMVDESNTDYASWTYDPTSGKATGSALAGNVDTDALTYDSNSTTVTDNLGTQRTYRFQDVAGGLRLTSISGPACHDCIGQSMTYDGNGYMQSALDWNNHQTNYTFDSNGLLLQSVEAVGTTVQRTTSTQWDQVLRVPLSRTVSDAGGTTLATTDWVYNTRGQPLARCEIDPAQAGSYACAASGSVPSGVRRWTYTYCDAVGNGCPLVGLRLSVTGPRTDLVQTTTYSYYPDSVATGCGTPGGACHQPGDLYQITDPLGHVTTIASYDADGRITRTTDANGINTDLTYTPRGWLASRSVGGATTTFAYTPYGAVASVTDPDNVTTTFTYDAAHRLTDITDAQGNRVHYTLDAAGNKTKEQVLTASGTVVRSLSRAYNTLGQLTAVIDGLNQTVFNANYSDSYDGNGNLVHSADALGVQRQQGFDALNRLQSTIANYNGSDPATSNTQTAFDHDALGRLDGVADPNGLNTLYTYDGLGNRTELSSPDTGTSTDTYDAAGNRLTHTDAKGVVSTSTYDTLNRVAAASYAGTTLFTYRYDETDTETGCSGSHSIGRLTRVLGNGGATVFCYDARGNVVMKRQGFSGHNDITTYSYTMGDRLASIDYPDNTLVSYQHDSAGRINRVTVTPPGVAAVAAVTNISYLPFGPISSYTLGNGQVITRTYDANERLTDLTSPALNLHLARDAMGDILALGNPATETYSYDPLYRLTGITDAGAALESYSYNRTGDRLSKTATDVVTGGGAYTYTTGTHQLASIGNAARTNDANGNTTGSVMGGNTYGFGYNSRNRLTTVSVR